MFLPRSDIATEMLMSHQKRFLDDSFTQSFKSWDTCMDNKACKIIAIVGIVIAVCIALSLIAWLLRIILCGAQATCAICASCCTCCCRKSSRSRSGAPLPNGNYQVPQYSPYYTGPPSSGLPPMPAINNNRTTYQPLKEEPIEMNRVSGHPPQSHYNYSSNY
ncbi:hypothetical protein V1511DRAFT_487577 [Dipodascopsis uninucleata]